MKPSDVPFRSAIHWCVLDTLGKVELEIAAGIITAYCKAHGDAWAPVSWTQLGEFILAESERAGHPLICPFAEPDFRGLIGLGLAAKRGADIDLLEIELTPKCLDLMARPGAWKVELR